MASEILELITSLALIGVLITSVLLTVRLLSNKARQQEASDKLKRQQ